MSKTLEQKNTRYLLLWLPIVLLLGSLLFLVMLDMHSHHAQEKLLQLKQQNIWDAIVAEAELPKSGIYGEYAIAAGSPIPIERLNKPRDSSLYYSKTGEKVDFKILTQQYNINGKTYQLTTYVSSKEFFHLTVKVFLTEALILMLLLVAIVIVNRKSSRFLWRPFYATLKKTGEYDVVKNASFVLPENTGTQEFDKLNSELTKLIEKINQAYSNQKQFVENASHEVQTPLAIIRSKLDLLINDPGLTEKNAALLGDITEANDRMSQMNKSLLLLAKIDNNQFPIQGEIPVSELLEKILSNYQEHYHDFPALSKAIEPAVYVTANHALLDILFSNLIKNAVVHNTAAGYIKVSLTQNECIIENTGHPITDEPALLFERFRKGNTDSKTTGLGLALVKQIAHLYNMALEYTYKENTHRIRLVFSRF